MKTRRTFAAVLGFIVMFALLASSAIGAHPMTHQGTVLAVQPTRVQIKMIDEKTKKESTDWFVIDKNTKVKRGEKAVSLADAKIAVNERIVIIVDMDAKTKNLAEEIRLAVK